MIRSFFHSLYRSILIASAHSPLLDMARSKIRKYLFFWKFNKCLRLIKRLSGYKMYGSRIIYNEKRQLFCGEYNKWYTWTRANYNMCSSDEPHFIRQCCNENIPRHVDSLSCNAAIAIPFPLSAYHSIIYFGGEVCFTWELETNQKHTAYDQHS